MTDNGELMLLNQNLKPIATAVTLALWGILCKAQTVQATGDLGKIENGCTAITAIPSTCASQQISTLPPINTNQWILSTSSTTGILIGTNLTDQNSGPVASGQVLVTDGGTVTSAYVYLGFEQNTSGTIKISGNGSKWTNHSAGVVGHYGNGEFHVTDGGIYEQINPDYFTIGYAAGSSGYLLVDGVNASGQRSSVILQNRLVVGYNGNGTVDIKNGGLIQAEWSPFVGQDSGGQGIINVDGVDAASGYRSSLIAVNNNIEIGRLGKASLNITNGGYAYAPSLIHTAGDLGDYGEINIDGVNIATGIVSSMESQRFYIGLAAEGYLNVTNGAQATASALISVGHNATGNGFVSIDGDGSKVTGTDTTIGYNGSGTLSLTNNGELQSTSLYVGKGSSSSGIINIGTGGVPGILNTTEIIGGDGNALINFNHIYNIDFTSKLSQNLNLKHINSGTTTLLNANDYTGATTISRGTLSAGLINSFSPASHHEIETQGELNLNGYNQILSSIENSGTITLSKNSLTAPVTTLEITGSYLGKNGFLNVATVLAIDGSASDKMLLNGINTQATGHTIIQVTNVGGLGAQTSTTGIPIIVTGNGASLSLDSFSLYGNHIDAGAFEYRLIQDSQGAALHSTLIVPSGPVTYRPEVPLISALPEQIKQADMAMLGNLHLRMGDTQNILSHEGLSDTKQRSWGRVIRNDIRIQQQGTVSPTSKGRLSGFQIGTDFYRSPSLEMGAYFGQLEGDIHVTGFSSGIQNNAAGHNYLRNRYLGAYGTWRDASGMYADAVIQNGSYRTTLHTASRSTHVKGSGWQASFEVGQPFAVSSKWQIEPQAQLIYRHLKIKDAALGTTSLQHQIDDDWMLRLGARVKGEWSTSQRLIQLYGRANIYKSSNSSNTAVFHTPAAITPISAKAGHTSIELAVGGTWHLNANTSLYGEFGRLWANSGNARTSNGLQASFGVKVRW